MKFQNILFVWFGYNYMKLYGSNKIILKTLSFKWNILKKYYSLKMKHVENLRFQLTIPKSLRF